MAVQLSELDVHAKLCYGDVRASEIYYHKTTCHMQFRNRYRSLQQQEKNTSTERKNNSSGVLCMEADIQYDI